MPEQSVKFLMYFAWVVITAHFIYQPSIITALSIYLITGSIKYVRAFEGGNKRNPFYIYTWLVADISNYRNK